MDNFIRVLVMAPLFFLAWCGLSYRVLGYVPDGHVRTAIMVTVLCIASGIYIIWTKRKALRNRVYLDIRPNTIEVVNAELFQGTFSSETSFLVSAEEFQKTLRSVAGRKSHVQGRFLSLRESAYVRIWPGQMEITDLELEALAQALNEEFIDWEIEVITSDAADLPRDTAIQA